VLTAWDDYGYGYHVIIQHDDGSQTQYAHLSDIWVGQGQYVSQGEAVGGVGSTGYSTGTHLMFNMYIGGAPVNPLDYLP
jgi:murein DD-endopeptidase MepM/ murein hydrolase activator NlpD